MLTVAWPFALGFSLLCVLKSSHLSFGMLTFSFLEVASNIPLCLRAGILVHVWLGNYH